MAINWFPGHMNKAKREIAELMPRIDLIIEILDARIPFSSENPLIQKIRGDTPCLKLLNKSDLAEASKTKAWMEYFDAQEGVTAIDVTRENPKKVKSSLRKLRKKLIGKKSRSRPDMMLILGIPNVGKSTIINTLTGRAIAKTGNKPAVTKQQQQVRIDQNTILVDTPGFLWPKLDPPECGYRLAVTGAIKDSVVDSTDIATFALKYLMDHYSEALQRRYKLESLGSEPLRVLEAIAKKRVCITHGGEIDFHKVSELLIHELRQGIIGPLTLELPSDYQS